MSWRWRYRAIGAVLGGGSGQVQVVSDRVLGGVGVLKCLPVGHAGAPDLALEAARLGDLRHPHLIERIDRFGPEGGEVGLVSRWVDGEKLLDAARGRSLTERIQAFGQLCEAVAYLHRRGLLHLDLKPDNVLWGSAGVVVLDLGSARTLDAGPGEAGGTLGWAAPEVYAGQAASVAADLFGLGALLYGLLTSRSPYADLEGSALRRAVLDGEVVPVRVRSPEVPLAMARVCEQMLSPQAGFRPANIAEVRERLGLHSDPLEGEPAFTGRDGLRTELVRRLQAPGGAHVHLHGPPGSGRRRIARNVLGELSGKVVDCSQGDRCRALDGLALCAGLEMPDRSRLASWVMAMEGPLREGRLGPLTLCLGDRGAIPEEERAALARLIPALVAGGAKVLDWAEEPGPGETVEVGPLPEAAVEEIASSFHRFGREQARNLRRRSGGWPGPLLRLLRGIEAPIGLLGHLPLGIPRAFFEASGRVANLGGLPEELARELGRCLQEGTGRWGEGERLFLDGALCGEPGQGLPEGRRDELLVILRAMNAEGEGTWQALGVCRLGATAEARGLVEGPNGQWIPFDNRPELVGELAERLHAAGVRSARGVLARLREEAGDLEGVLGLLGGAEDRSPQESLRLARSLRRNQQVDEAAAVLQDLFGGEQAAEAYLELAQLRVLAKDWVGSRTALERAEAIDPELAGGAALKVRVVVAVNLLSRGEYPEEARRVAGLVEKATERSDSRALSAAGRIFVRLGEKERGERLLERAAARADEEGDLRAAAGIRLNRANALVDLGKGREARKCYRLALGLAAQAQDADLLFRLRYSLADLELRSGRLPEAEAQVAAFQVEALQWAARSGGKGEGQARAAELAARLWLARERPAEALAALRAVEPGDLAGELRNAHQMIRAEALIGLGRAEEALPVLEALPRGENPGARWRALRGRALLALGRRELSVARAGVPEEPEAVQRLEAGEILLAAAGEDLDPEDFARRRRDLEKAARLLRGGPAGRAAGLRDRLLEGPGANLEGIVRLTEAIQEPGAFVGALAGLLGEALGAYRALIMVRIPGMGRQVSYTELSGAEAAGIGAEVLRRLRKADDYWLAHDAFSDPALRESSQTVRTFELKSLLAVAIPRGEEAVGALYVDDLYRANRFGEKDVAMMRRLARAIGRWLPMLGSLTRSGEWSEPREVLGILLGEARQARELEETIGLLRGQAQVNLLISGPTGAGKSRLAQRVAKEVFGLEGLETVVARRGDPQFLVTMLAGAERGEFTGATQREGAIERCLRGRRALFIDEVQNLDEVGQQILLPLLELGGRHFGGITRSSVALRGPLQVILGTNVPLGRGRWKEHFREDLWYRMSAHHLELPSLAERGPEVVYLHLSSMLVELGVGSPEEVFSSEALHRATRWGWPGNLRQLQVFAERAAGLVRLGQTPIGLGELGRLGIIEEGELEGSESLALDGAMVEHVLRVLQSCRWVQKEAAAELRMSPSRLNKLLKRHGLLEEVQARRRELSPGEDPPEARVGFGLTLKKGGVEAKNDGRADTRGEGRG